MAVSVGDVFLVTIEGECNAQRIMFTHTYEVSAITGSTDELIVSADLAERLSANGADILETSYLNCMPSNYNLDRITAQKIYPVRYRREDEPRPVAGNIANAALSANVAAVISLHTEFAGRRHVSNKHIGPLATAVGWYVDGELTAGYKAVLGALRSALLVDVGAAGWYTMKPCIFHRGAVTPKSDYLRDGTVEDTVRVMRRRTVGLGI